MQTLVIHPKDPTTEFLTPIYANLKDTIVIRDGITKSELRLLIDLHDRIIMLGHGYINGLLNPGQFPGAGLFIIDDSFSSVLRKKSNCIFIWCHADEYVRNNGLSGVCSGMFISETGEASLYGFENINKSLIDESNSRFAAIMSKCINKPFDIMFNDLLIEYSMIARKNPIAKFNLEGLNLCGSGILFRAN